MGRALALFWIAGTAIVLLVIALGVLTQPGFPLGLGLVRTTGLTGLWVTLVPAVVGLVGVVLVRRSSRFGGGLTLLYSGFWAVLVASGLPIVWNAKRSFCFEGLGVCIRGPWLGRLMVLGLLAPFILSGVWSWRALTASEAPSGSARPPAS